MGSFTDSSGREWVLRITAPLIDKIRADGDADFLRGKDEPGSTIERLANDGALTCHVIYHLCERQRNDRNVTFDAFYDQVLGDGEAIEAAGEALEKAIVNFTPTRRREFVSAIVSKQREVEGLAMDEALARINDPALVAKVKESLTSHLDEAFSKLTRQSNATSSPGSAE